MGRSHISAGWGYVCVSFLFSLFLSTISTPRLLLLSLVYCVLFSFLPPSSASPGPRLAAVPSRPAVGYHHRHRVPDTYQPKPAKGSEGYPPEEKKQKWAVAGQSAPAHFPLPMARALFHSRSKGDRKNASGGVAIGQLVSVDAIDDREADATAPAGISGRKVNYPNPYGGAFPISLCAHAQTLTRSAAILPEISQTLSPPPCT